MHAVARSIDPATGLTIAEYPLTGQDRLERKLEVSSAAFALWSGTPLEARCVVLARMAALFEDRVDNLAEMIVEEVGKTIGSAEAEIRKCAYTLRFYAEHARELLAEEQVSVPGFSAAEVRYLPLGPVLAIMPWNFPFFQVVRFIAPALASGNACLLKHAENVPRAALALEGIGRDAGLPEGVFQSLFIDVATVARVIADPRVAAVTLTGSERAGRSVAAEAGKALKKCVLELGGSDPLIVMPSADIDAAARAAVTSRMMNNGQSCICAKRFIVADPVYEAFIARVVGLVRELRVGDPRDPATKVGPLVSERARDALDAQVEAARQAGATILAGGSKIDGAGWFFEPTLIADIPECAAIRQEEFFGPVAMIFRAKDRDDALRIANETPFGLGSSVWTAEEPDKAFFALQLQAGMTFFNSIVASDPHIPFGGVKNSGFGREFGLAGIREFVNIKSVVTA